MSGSKTNAYLIKWDGDFTFDKFKALNPKSLESPTRIITIQVQKERVCLVASSEYGFMYVPFYMQDGTWRRVPARDLRIEAVPDAAFTNEESLKESLTRQMMLQFRSSVAGFYADLPSHREVLSVITAHPRKSTMRAAKYPFYKITVVEDPEFDGAFEVYCNGGSLIVPYVGDPESDATLLPEYANFVKNMDYESVFDRIGQRLDGLAGLFSNFHWSNFRTKLEGVWRTNV